MTEPAYRRAHNLGAGAAGGLGLGDEFVLVDVKVSDANNMSGSMSSSDNSTGSSASSSNSSMSSSSSTSSASMSTCADQGVAYRLTGTAEEHIKGLVGHQLEVQGRFKHANDASATGTSATGTSSTSSTSSTSTTDDDKKLPPEVEIVSFREAPVATTAAMSTTSNDTRSSADTTSTTPMVSTRTQPQYQPQPQTPTTTTPTTSFDRSSTTDTSATTTPRRMPHTASAMPLLAALGALALAAGFALTVLRRHAL